MTPKDLHNILQQGENSSVEFKESGVRPESVAREIVAFANSTGGVIVIGVADSGSIVGLDTTRNFEEWVMNIARTSVTPALSVLYEQVEIEGKKLGVITVPKGADKPYQTGDKYLVRVGSTNRIATQAELMRLFQMSGVFHYDTVPVTGATINDLNHAALDSYFSGYEIEFSKEDSAARSNLLTNTDIITTDQTPTVAGMLLFGVNPGRFLPQCGIMFAHYSGNEPDDELIDRQQIAGTLPQQVDTACAVVKNNLLRPSHIEGVKRKETSVMPAEKVFREILVNACVHRNYAITGSQIRIAMFDDRIEFISPGRLPNTVTVEKLRSGVSYATNPVLVKFMDNLRYMDRLGRGFPMIYREMQKLGLQILVQELGEELRVTLFLKVAD
jgi:ATP-dependent DNA helicase RecG